MVIPFLRKMFVFLNHVVRSKFIDRTLEMKVFTTTVQKYVCSTKSSQTVNRKNNAYKLNINLDKL